METCGSWLEIWTVWLETWAFWFDVWIRWFDIWVCWLEIWTDWLEIWGDWLLTCGLWFDCCTIWFDICWDWFELEWLGWYSILKWRYDEGVVDFAVVSGSFVGEYGLYVGRGRYGWYVGRCVGNWNQVGLFVGRSGRWFVDWIICCGTNFCGRWTNCGLPVGLPDGLSTGFDTGRDNDDAGSLVGLADAGGIGSNVVCFTACVEIDGGCVGRFVGRLFGFLVGRFVGRFTGRFEGRWLTVSIFDSICSSKSTLVMISPAPDPSWAWIEILFQSLLKATLTNDDSRREKNYFQCDHGRSFQKFWLIFNHEFGNDPRLKWNGIYIKQSWTWTTLDVYYDKVKMLTCFTGIRSWPMRSWLHVRESYRTWIAVFS